MNPLIIIAGPTAVGKSDIAVKLAKDIKGQIISADSIQVYKGMDIGSAKIAKDEMGGIKHHLIDVLDPREEFGVNVFQDMSKEAISQIYRDNELPIVVGGTGFYIQGLLYDIDFNDEEGDKEYRNKLTAMSELPHGKEKLYDRLKELDPDYAASLHYNNVKRVIRALEYHKHTGRLFSEYNREQSERKSPYDFLYFALNLPREELYERIDKRVNIMFDMGLVDEVVALKEKGYTGNLQSMQGIGYREIWSYIDGEISLEEAKELIKKNTRHFAKRQLTWLRREKDVIFIDKEKYSGDREIIEYMKDIMRNEGIIQ